MKHTIEVTTTHNDEVFGTRKEVDGPGNLAEWVKLLGESGVVASCLKVWKAEQAVTLRAALNAAVKGEQPKAGKRSGAKFIQV